MLFNSYLFILVFLPIAVVGFYAIGSKGAQRMAILWLFLVSLFFYGWWNPVYLWLISASLLFNYTIGVALSKYLHPSLRKCILTGGIAANVVALGYFKYASFIVTNLHVALGTNYHLEKIILPLAISFFTFEQIAYVVDVYRGETEQYEFPRYCIFVIFFPQLIAGPIVHHNEMLPQFAKDKTYRLNPENLAVGITIFTIGLFKKVVFADRLAEYATPVFDVAGTGAPLTFFETWFGALAYTFQLYFDFSGYSDLAIGTARMFGILLPLNFHSPYKANNIIEFWRRWHITLSRFLKDYLYVPLGGNRKGEVRRSINIMLTMLLGGLWHGAAWNFALWGTLHGVYLLVNQAWRKLSGSLGRDLKKTSMCGRGASWLITFTAVVVGWVFFRAESLDGAINMLRGMSGQQGFALPSHYLRVLNKIFNLGDYVAGLGLVFDNRVFVGGGFSVASVGLLVVAALSAWYGPNTQQFMIRYRPALEIYRGEIKAWRFSGLRWENSRAWALGVALTFALSLFHLTRISEFLYFNF
jgi:D-alanyl-lipoteichoic acid acyltransferase DltB (MBOAT superfamily)